MVSVGSFAPLLALTLLIGSDAARLKRTSKVQSAGNRGTGLAPGAWKVDGGLTYLGQTLADADINIDCVSIDDNAFVANILDSSVVNGSNVIPGGYQGVTMTYQRVNFGWFDNRDGYFVEQAICTMAGQCLQKAFVQENQNKLMVYAHSPTLGLTVWVVSGNGASQRAAAAHDVVSQANIPLAVTDCGDAGTIARLSGYAPTSVNTGETTTIRAWGTISEDVQGGTMNMDVRMTGFPWTGLGSVSNRDICGPIVLELRALGIWGGTLEFEGLECPVSAASGEITLPIKLTLASALPGGMANVRADMDGTASSGKPLLCAYTTTSR